jgi:endonuclease/exonuclease/phosphatase (EEP) superfamily protein YafD
LSEAKNMPAPSAAPAGADSRPPGKSRRGRLECDLGILAGLAGLIGSRLGQLWVAFDVFAQFFLQFAVVTLAFLIGRIVRRARLTTALVLLIAGLAAIGAWPHLASRAPRVLDVPKAGERALTFASFNTWYGNPDREALRAEIERLGADVVTLIELAPDKRPMLADLRPHYPHQADCFEINFCNLAILSKIPLGGSEARVGWEGPPLIAARLGAEAGGVAVIGVHTIRFPHSRAQFRQILALSNFIAAMPGRKVVMGDFNATPFSRITATLAARTGLVRLTSLPSWPAQFGLPQFAIDHIFASSSIRAIEGQRIGEPAGSDHFPVAIRLALPVD